MIEANLGRGYVVDKREAEVVCLLARSGVARPDRSGVYPT